MKTRVLATACLSVGLTLVSGAVFGQQIYNNWNTDACGFTDRAGVDLDGPTRLNAVELWYRWGHQESEVGYALFLDGRFVRNGRLMRADCDPYQEAWCGARGSVGVDLPPGHVDIRVARGKVCQNAGSNGEGFIHVYGMQR